MEVVEKVTQPVAIKNVAGVTTHQKYGFTLSSFDVVQPRSGSFFGEIKGKDSNHVGFHIQINNNTGLLPETKFIDNCHSGVFPVNLSYDSIQLADSDVVSIIVAIINTESNIDADIKSALTILAAKAGQAITKIVKDDLLTDAVKSAIIEEIGTSLGTVALPGAGALIGAALSFVTGELESVILPNCDGVVVSDILVYSGAQLRTLMAGHNPVGITINYPGTDSPDGCGCNSNYNVTYSFKLDSVVNPLVATPVVSSGTQKKA